MKLLSIGNSFSQDAQRYLHRVAKEDGESLKTVNLYIGGCTLRTHYINMLEDLELYDFQFNGESTGLKVSIREALISDEWDVITLQQASHKSYDYDSYTPYIEELYDYVKTYAPKAKIYIHETWAYERESERLLSRGFATPEDMLVGIRSAYGRARALIGADGFIPSGEAVQRALELGLPRFHRDTFHASYGVGRYLLALVWYKVLFGKDITENTFSDFDEPVTDEERRIAIAAVNDTVK